MADIHYSPTSSQLAVDAKAYFLELLAEILEKQRIAVVALAGGRSLLPLYRELNNSITQLLPYSGRVKFCLADERLVPDSSDDRNYQNILQHFDPSQFGCEFQNIDQSSQQPAADYAKSIGKVDLTILGAGEDGHIASLFPKHPGLDLIDDLYEQIEDSPKPPPARISLSSAWFLSGMGASIVCVLGEEKLPPLVNYTNPNLDFRSCPLKLINSHPQSRIFTDQQLAVE